MTLILLIILYVASVLLCGYLLYKLTVKDLQNNSGIINLGTLVLRIILPIIPAVNISIIIAFTYKYMYNTDIKFNIEDKNENPN